MNSIQLDKPFAWGDCFLLGYGPMDRLHHDFVDRVAEAMAVDKNGMLHALEKVGTHLEEHFSEERLWMESSGFPATECHVEEHEAVLKSYRDVLTHLQEDLGFENAKSESPRVS